MKPFKAQHRPTHVFYSLKKKVNLLALLLCSLTLLLASCGDSSTGPDDGGDNGNGDDPTFTNVQTVLNNSCGGSGCHLEQTTSGVRLDSYENVINSEGNQYGGPIVVADEPDDSPIVDKIESDPEYGKRMPRVGAALSSDEITLIRNWIAEGALDN